MNSGDLAYPMFRATNNGQPIPIGLVQLSEPVGTVPNLWKVIRLDPRFMGQSMMCFVYEDELAPTEGAQAEEIVDPGLIELDLIAAGKARAINKPPFRLIIDGGK